MEAAVSQISIKDDECSMCRSELYLNPNMKLLQSVCGHRVYADVTDSASIASRLLYCMASLPLTHFVAGIV